MRQAGFSRRDAKLIENTGNNSDLRGEKIFQTGVLLVYILIATANIATHEIWRDEFHVWFTETASSSLPGLFANMKCQGHPPLWYLMLYAVSRVTHDAAGMKVMHLAVAIGAAYVFVRFAPFTRLQRLLFVFGYFPLYEYAAISRNYGIGVLLLFCFCAACGAAKKNFLVLAIILSLLSMANAYTFIITVCLLAVIGLKAAIDADARAVLIRQKWMMLLYAAIVASGLVFSAAVMRPEADCQYAASGWTTGFDIDKLVQVFASAWQGLVPIPQLTRFYWWNTNIVPWQVLQGILGAVLLLFLLLSMAKKLTVFLFFSLAVGAMLVFEYVVYYGYLRHFGHFFIVLIACLWLERVWGNDKPTMPGFLSKLSKAFDGPKRIFIIVLLCIHFSVGIFASVMEWQYPFSQGKNAARYIKEKGLDKLPIVGYMDFVASSVAGYLDRPFYYPNSDSFGTFIVFDNKRKLVMGAQDVVDRAMWLADKNKSDVLLVLYVEIESDSRFVIPLKNFTGNIQGDEEYYLYLLKYQRQ
jgi:hypothetical protein